MLQPSMDNNKKWEINTANPIAMGAKTSLDFYPTTCKTVVTNKKVATASPTSAFTIETFGDSEFAAYPESSILGMVAVKRPTAKREPQN